VYEGLVLFPLGNLQLTLKSLQPCQVPPAKQALNHIPRAPNAVVQPNPQIAIPSHAQPPTKSREQVLMRYLHPLVVADRVLRDTILLQGNVGECRCFCDSQVSSQYCSCHFNGFVLVWVGGVALPVVPAHHYSHFSAWGWGGIRVEDHAECLFGVL